MTLGLEYGLFFRNPAGAGGTLRLVGWTADDGGERRFVVTRGDQRLGEFSCERRFDVLLPVPTALEDTSEVDISAAGSASSHPSRRVTVTSADLVFARDIVPAGLTPRQTSKLRNLFTNEGERLHGAGRLRSKPLYLLVDPSFSCQLRCPSCHGDMLREQGVSMRHLEPEVLQRLLDAYGDTLILMYFANWGEPLLNPRFETLVPIMKRHEIWVTTSTNLSLPLSDARVEALVRSGIDQMILSIDGATQETYERYRGRGDLALVLDNVRRLVAARRRLGSSTPRLRWQFLLFPWNRHEVDEARRLSDSLGCDEFEAHDGDINPRVTISRERRLPGPVRVEPEHRDRLLDLRVARRAGGRFFGCDHLYHQLAVNSDGSVHPCCYVIAPGHLVGQVRADEPVDLFNHEVLQDSRRLLASADAIRAGVGHDPCAGCTIVTARGGHVTSALDFFSGVELVTGRPLRAFLPPSVDRRPRARVARAIRRLLSRA